MCFNIIKAGILPVAIEFMDRPCIEATETFSALVIQTVRPYLLLRWKVVWTKLMNR